MLYVARHGQTKWNALNKVCGITDLDLTEKGIEQAKTLACRAQEKDINLIITSPLKRAVETSKIVSEFCNKVSNWRIYDAGCIPSLWSYRRYKMQI